MSNRIEKDLTRDDLITIGNGKSAATLAAECLEHLERGCPYSATFLTSIPFQSRAAAEAELKEAFELWANSWIAPKLLAIMAKTKA